MKNKINFKTPALCVAVGIIFAVIAVMLPGAKEKITVLNRPEIGSVKKDYKLNVSYDGMDTDINITLSERKLSFSEAQTIFGHCYDEIIKIMEEKNGTLNNITDNLYLPETVLGDSVTVTWKSMDRQYIYDDGVLNMDGCKRITSDTGMAVVMIAGMSVQDYKADIEIPICIGSDIFTREERQIDLIREEINKVAEESLEKDSIELPVQIEGKNIEYYRVKEETWWQYIILGILAGTVCILMQKRKEVNERKKREKELKLAYAPLVTKLTLLIGAGTTIRGAWEKIISDYKKGNKKNVAYEEMIRVYNEMQNGLFEGQAYVLFGRRCRLSEYVKLGNLLEQNLKKGTRGLTDRLENEVFEAYEERKALAYRLGEEAGTKLLIPMALSLGIVIAVCVVPAFLNM